MTREAQEREDFLAEARNLTERAEFRLADQAESLLVGFRPDGCGSIYFGPERVYHFNVGGELRRGHLHGLLYKAERERLIRMERHRLQDRVELRSRPLSHAEQKQFLGEMNQYLNVLFTRLSQGAFTVVEQVPATANVAARVIGWLNVIRKQPKVATAPNAA